MSQAIIRAAFESRLAAWAASKSIPVAYQNVAFTPPSGTYARVFIIPGETASDDLAQTHRRYRGIFQVSLLMPLGSGSGQAEALVAELEALFSPTTPLTQSGLTIYLTAPMSAAIAIPEDTHYAVPVSTAYRVDL